MGTISWKKSETEWPQPKVVLQRRKMKDPLQYYSSSLASNNIKIAS